MSHSDIYFTCLFFSIISLSVSSVELVQSKSPSLKPTLAPTNIPTEIINIYFSGIPYAANVSLGLKNAVKSTLSQLLHVRKDTIVCPNATDVELRIGGTSFGFIMQYVQLTCTLTISPIKLSSMGGLTGLSNYLNNYQNVTNIVRRNFISDGVNATVANAIIVSTVSVLNPNDHSKPTDSPSMSMLHPAANTLTISSDNSLSQNAIIIISLCVSALGIMLVIYLYHRWKLLHPKNSVKRVVNLHDTPCI